jgi:hypothetical protein
MGDGRGAEVRGLRSEIRGPKKKRKSGKAEWGKREEKRGVDCPESSVERCPRRREGAKGEEEKAERGADGDVGVPRGERRMGSHGGTESTARFREAGRWGEARL